jgi:hypothetical protein
MSIFISYRRNDSADIAGRIYDRLVEAYGTDLVFKDVDNIPIGTDYKAYLRKMLEQCAVELVIIGPTWVDSRDPKGALRLDDPNDFVRLEVKEALKRDIPVIPMLIKNASMPEEEELPKNIRGLASRQAIPIRSDPDFHRDMNRLIKGLGAHVAQAAKPSDRPNRSSGEQSFSRRWWRVATGLLAAIIFSGMAIFGRSDAVFQIGSLFIALLSGIITISYLIRQSFSHALVYFIAAIGFVSFGFNPGMLPPATVEEYVFAAIPIFFFGPIAFLWSLIDAIQNKDA